MYNENLECFILFNIIKEYNCFFVCKRYRVTETFSTELNYFRVPKDGMVHLIYTCTKSRADASLASYGTKDIHKKQLFICIPLTIQINLLIQTFMCRLIINQI